MDSEDESSRAPQPKDAVIDPLTCAFSYLLYPDDKDEFSFLNRDVDQADSMLSDRDAGLDQFVPDGLSKNRRLLLAGYLTLYVIMRPDGNVASRRDALLRKMQIPPELQRKIEAGVSRFGASLISAPDSPIRAVFHPSPAVVKQMTALVAALSLGREYVFRTRVDGLAPQEYEHALDRQLLNALQKTMGFETLVRAVFKHGVERLMTIAYTGSNLRLGTTQLPPAYAMIVDACDLLDLPRIPDVYVQQGFINAATIGSENPILVFDSGCFGALDESEFLFIAGHELGHVKSGHCLYTMIAQLVTGGLLSPLLDTISSMTLGISGAVTLGLECALLNWQRTSEFTADRAGLLCCQDIDAALRCMIKLSGAPPGHYDLIDIEAFKAQARDFRELDFSTRDKIIKTLSILGATHPWTVMRGHELLKWHESGEYQRVLERHTRQYGAATVRTNRESAASQPQIGG